MNSELLYKKFFEQTYYFVYKNHTKTFNKKHTEFSWNIEIYNLQCLFSMKYYNTF